MADYKELIRKAIQALPENNGAARRAVYEKARSALVGQLRALDPPLSAREITQHRLQLEDCIRQVEQEASEAVIAGLKQNEDVAGALPRGGTNGAVRPNGAPPAGAAARPAVRPSAAVTGAARPNGAAPGPQRPTPTAPVPVAPRLAAQGQPTAAVATAAPARSIAPGQVAVLPQPAAEADAAKRRKSDTIEDIIAAASGDATVADTIIEDNIEADDGDAAPAAAVARLETPFVPHARNGANGLGPAIVTPLARGETRPVPSIVARAEAAKAAHAEEAKAPELPGANGLGSNGLGRGADDPPERPHVQGRAALIDPTFGQGSKPSVLASSTALSTVREVDLEEPSEGDPQIAIERAIATLEREARNDGEEANGAEADGLLARGNGKDRRRGGEGAFREPAENEAVFARAPVEAERGGNALMIFLLVFLALLVIAGGAGFWAWREGFIDFDAMFGKQGAAVSDQSVPVTAPAAPAAPATPPPAANNVPAPTAAPVPPNATAPAANGSTNTEPAANTPAQSAEQMSAAPATPAPATPAPTPSTPAPAAAPAPAAQPAEPSAQNGAAPKSEERLTQSTEATPAPAAPGTAAAGAAASGSQSLLLEASQDGTTGAVPFSGTVDWSKGTDELGQPTLVGKANIPARNLSVSVLIRKNSDPTLPASHLMEINFSVTDSFIGGSISGLPGVLLKNEELVQGTPLIGASARVVGNSFLFALSSSQADEATNKDLLTSRKWMDLAIIYATGKKAIITLEKDDKAEALFNDVFAAWSKGSPPAAAPSPASSAPPPPVPSPAAAKVGG